MKEPEVKLIVFSYLAPYIFVALLILMCIIGTCIDSHGVDPMDNSIMKGIEYVEQLRVLDKTGNGFRVVYVTVNAVTKPRLEEIQSRPPIRTAFLKLQREAPLHFGGSLLDTDIHDFARFAREFDCDNQIKIHCIFVEGLEKMKHYIGPNPKIPNSAEWMNMQIEQGNQWINSSDVYGSGIGDYELYRYWKCQFPYDTSTTDEQFSHFSEDNRLK